MEAVKDETLHALLLAILRWIENREDVDQHSDGTWVGNMASDFRVEFGDRIDVMLKRIEEAPSSVGGSPRVLSAAAAYNLCSCGRGKPAEDACCSVCEDTADERRMT